VFVPPTATRFVAYVWRLKMSSVAKKPSLSKNGKRLGRPPKTKLTVVKEPKLTANGKRRGRPPKVDVPVVVETPSLWKRLFGWLV